MLLARVIGSVWATVKDPGLVAQKLLILQPLTPDRRAVGDTLVALDAVGVGMGEDVFYVKGREATYPFLPGHVPADAAIVGRVDAIESAGTST